MTLEEQKQAEFF